MHPQFDSAKGFSEGLSAVKMGNKWSYINKEGISVIDLSFGDLSEAYGFQGGLAMLSMDVEVVGYMKNQG